MCKGADVSILSRLSEDIYKKDQNEKLLYMKEIILRRMKRYTLKGYRGLLMAIRFLSKKELKYFKKRYSRICEMELEQKKEEYQKFLVDLESELVLIGGSAVEDKLQKNLKDTIHSFRNAQMKIWVLTGDKWRQQRTSPYHLDCSKRYLYICNYTAFIIKLGGKV